MSAEGAEARHRRDDIWPERQEARAPPDPILAASSLHGGEGVALRISDQRSRGDSARVLRLSASQPGRHAAIERM